MVQWVTNDTNTVMYQFIETSNNDRCLADGNIHCVGSATYQIFLGYRTRTKTRSLTLNPEP